MFDIFNSRSKFSKGLNAPIHRDNIQTVVEYFHNATEYIASLKMPNSAVLLVNGPRRRAFLGFIINMDSLQYIYKDYVMNDYLDYVLTYKLSQDHLGFNISYV